MGYHACVVETGLLELHSIGQANQNSIASMLLLGGFGGMFSRKILKLHALTRMESEGISNIFCIRVLLTLAVHITISYSYLFIYNYFNQSCYCVTFTDLNDPLGSDPVPGWTHKRPKIDPHCIRCIY